MSSPPSPALSQGGDWNLSLVPDALVHTRPQLQRWLEEAQEGLKAQERITTQEKHRVTLLKLELDKTKCELDAAIEENEDQKKRVRSLEKMVWQLQARETELTNELRKEQVGGSRRRCDRCGGELGGGSGSGASQAGFEELSVRVAQVEAQRDDARRECGEALQVMRDAEQEALRARRAVLQKEEDLARARQDAHQLYVQSEEIEARLAVQNQEIIPLRFRIVELEELVASLRSASTNYGLTPQEPTLAMELGTGDGGQALLEEVRELEAELRDREARGIEEAAQMEEMRRRLSVHRRDDDALRRMLERAQNDVEVATTESNTEAQEVLRLRDALAVAVKESYEESLSVLSRLQASLSMMDNETLVARNEAAVAQNESDEWRSDAEALRRECEVEAIKVRRAEAKISKLQEVDVELYVITEEKERFQQQAEACRVRLQRCRRNEEDLERELARFKADGPPPSPEGWHHSFVALQQRLAKAEKAQDAAIREEELARAALANAELAAKETARAHITLQTELRQQLLQEQGLIATLRKDLSASEGALHDCSLQAAELEQLLRDERRRRDENSKPSSPTAGDLQDVLKFQLYEREEEIERLEEAVTMKDTAFAAELEEGRWLQRQLDETRAEERREAIAVQDAKTETSQLRQSGRAEALENMQLQRHIDEWRDRAQIAASRVEAEEELVERAEIWERAAQSEVGTLKQELDEARRQAKEKSQHRSSVLDAVRAERDANQRTVEHLRYELIDEQREALRHQRAAASRANAEEEEIARAEMWILKNRQLECDVHEWHKRAQAAASRADTEEEEFVRAEIWKAAARSEVATLQKELERAQRNDSEHSSSLLEKLRAECDTSQRQVEHLRYELIVEQREAKTGTAKLQQDLLEAQRKLLETVGNDPMAINTLRAQRDIAQEEVTHYKAQRDLVQEEAARLQAALTETRAARDTEVELVRRLQKTIENMQKNNQTHPGQQPSLSWREALALKDDLDKWRKTAEAAKEARDAAERECQKALKLIRRYEEQGPDLNNGEMDLLRQECIELLDACGQLLLRSQKLARSHDPRLGKQMEDLISHLGTRVDGFRSRHSGHYIKHHARPRQATTKRRSSQLSRCAVSGQLWDWVCRTAPPGESREPQAHRQSSRTGQEHVATEPVVPTLRDNIPRSRPGQEPAAAGPVVPTFRDNLARTGTFSG